MSKRRKTKKGGRRRRRVGAFGMGGKDTALKLAAIAGGFLLGKTINAQIDKVNTKVVPATATTAATTTTMVPKTVVTVGELGIGALLLLRKSSGTMGMVTKVAGGVLAGVGLRNALGQMGIMSGYQSVPVIGRHRMAGYQSVPVIGNNKTPVQLSGKTPAQLQGFRVNGYTPTGSNMGVMGSMGAIESGGSGITTSCGSGCMG